MKKTLIGLLLVLFVAGCVDFGSLKEGAETVKDRIDTELGITGYDMLVGDSITVNGKEVRLLSFDADYKIVFDVDGQQIEMDKTQDPQIVNDIEITIKKFNFDATDLDSNSVRLDIRRYVPELDHYQFYLENEIEILGHMVKFVKLDKDGSINLLIDSINDLRLMEGKTGDIANLYITNVKPNYRAIASERYVIIKVTEKP